MAWNEPGGNNRDPWSGGGGGGRQPPYCFTDDTGFSGDKLYETLMGCKHWCTNALPTVNAVYLKQGHKLFALANCSYQTLMETCCGSHRDGKLPKKKPELGLTSLVLFAALGFLVSGCQTTTSVDSRHAGAFSFTDSAPEKLMKLVEKGALEDAAIVYSEHIDSFSNTQTDASVQNLRSKVNELYQQSTEKMESVGETGNFKEDRIKITEADALINSLSEYAQVLSFEDSANELESAQKQAIQRRGKVLSDEAYEFIRNGIPPGYADIQAYMKSTKGALPHTAIKEICQSLTPSSSNIGAAVRCLAVSDKLLPDNVENELVEPVSIWTVVSQLSNIHGDTQEMTNDLSISEIKDLFRFNGLSTKIRSDLLTESPTTLVPSSKNHLLIAFERIALHEEVEAKAITSKFYVGTDRTRNLNYERARLNYNNAVRQQQNCLQAYYASAANNPYAINLCGLHTPRVSNARNILANTPRYNTKRVYEPYEFDLNEFDIRVEWRIIVVALDGVGSAKAIDFSLTEAESFKVAKGLHPKDSGYAAYKLDAESDIGNFIAKKPSVDFSLVLEEMRNSEPVDIALLEDRRPIIDLAALGNESESGYQSPVDDAILNDSIVSVSSGDKKGTGFYISDNFVVTNRHVIGDAPMAKLTNRAGQSATGVVLAEDRYRDVALLAVTELTGSPIQIADQRPRTGDELRAYGHPAGYEFSVTRGIVSAVRELEIPESVTGKTALFIQSDVAISPGNSGGPLISDGKVVGVITYKDIQTSSEGLSFSLSSEELLKWLGGLQVGRF
jgi:hypothetical protein